MNRKLSESLEDYLEAIARLIEVNGHAHTKEIATMLNVKMPSVTGALRQLEQLGYIVYNLHYPVQLTGEGEKVAGKIVERHMVLNKFFSDILGLSPERASLTACRLEHAVDEETIERFIIFSEAIEMREDAGKLRNYLAEAMSFPSREDFKDIILISRLAPGEEAVIELAGRNIPAEVREKLPSGAAVVLTSASPDESSYNITLDGTPLVIDSETAGNLWVKRI